MPTKQRTKTSGAVVSALTARSQFGRILRDVDEKERSFVVEKRGAPKAVILGIKDYIRLAAPEPEILRIIGERSKRNKTDGITMSEIDSIIAKARKARRSKNAPAKTGA